MVIFPFGLFWGKTLTGYFGIIFPPTLNIQKMFSKSFTSTSLWCFTHFKCWNTLMSWLMASRMLRLKTKPWINKKGFGRLHNNFTRKYFKGIISCKALFIQCPCWKFIRESMLLEALKGVWERIFLIPRLPFLQTSSFQILIPLPSEKWLEIVTPFPSADRLVPFSSTWLCWLHSLAI